MADKKNEPTAEEQPAEVEVTEETVVLELSSDEAQLLPAVTYDEAISAVDRIRNYGKQTDKDILTVVTYILQTIAGQ